MTDHTDTALGGALRKQGVLRHSIQFAVAITKFQNAGGTYDEAVNMLNLAYNRRPAEETAPMPVAPVTRPVTSITYDRSRPGHSRRGAAAIASVQPTIARSLFDTLVLPDGRTLRQVRLHECPKLAREYTRFTHILTAIHMSAISQDQTVTLDKVVSERELGEIVHKADEAGNAD
jgi:hypothetical protein